jgi:hypothetical protein
MAIWRCLLSFFFIWCLSRLGVTGVPSYHFIAASKAQFNATPTRFSPWYEHIKALSPDRKSVCVSIVLRYVMHQTSLCIRISCSHVTRRSTVLLQCERLSRVVCIWLGSWWDSRSRSLCKMKGTYGSNIRTQEWPNEPRDIGLICAVSLWLASDCGGHVISCTSSDLIMVQHVTALMARWSVSISASRNIRNVYSLPFWKQTGPHFESSGQTIDRQSCRLARTVWTPNCNRWQYKTRSVMHWCLVLSDIRKTIAFGRFPGFTRLSF